MNRYFVAVVFALVLLPAALAIAPLEHSPEPVVTRTVGYNPATREYNFSCYPNRPGLDEVRHWAVRPEVTQATFEYQSTSPYFSYVLDKDVMYHVSCGVLNGTKFVQSDYHIDRRVTRNQPEKPYITVSWSNGTAFAAHCDPPVNTTHYIMRWWNNNYVDRIARTDLEGQQNINTTVAYPALWEIVCGTWDTDQSKWSQISYTVEFFSSGQAYTPSVTGCVPNEPCYQNGTISPPPVVDSCDVTDTLVEGETKTYTINSLDYETTAVFAETSAPAFAKVAVNGEVSPSLNINQSATFSDGSRIKIQSIQNWQHNMAKVTFCFNGTRTPPTQNSTCATSVQALPASCTGGTITQDTTSGCRTITCSGTGKSLQILACDKPSSSSAQYFEMYKQSQTGSGLEICLGATCLQDEGYIKSANYPLCIGNVTIPPNTTNSTNTTIPPTQNATCYSNLQTLPANCTGTITQDAFSGCRTLSCTSTGGSIGVLACEKPSSSNAQYFEIYRQSGTGAAPRLCLGTTCIQNEGYVKSTNFPICVGNITVPPVVPPNSTNTTNSTNSTSTVALNIAPWFPQGRSYVFVCNATGFTPSTYDFSFGDGNQNNYRTQSDVYYTYASAGTFNVSCVAKNTTFSKSGSLLVNVV